MAINWFEGGRRISSLGIGLVVAAGAATIIWNSDPDPVLTSRGPSLPWFVSDRACPDDAYIRDLWNYDWGGKQRGLKLCFLVYEGRVPYAVAPTPKEELEKQERARREREAKGEPPVITFDMPWFYTAPAYDDRVQSYVEKSVADLRISPDLEKRLKDSLWSVWWRGKKQAFEAAAPWVFGICAGLWFFTLVVGWIVRGFAGVPNGQDFRPAKSGREPS